MRKIIGFKSLIILSFIFFSFPITSQADPQITGLTGILNSNRQIDLVGNNFGTRVQATPKYFNNYSTTTTGQLPRGLSNTSTTFGGFVSLTNARIASKPLIKFNYTCTAPSNGSNCEAWSRDYFDFGVSGTTEVYVSAWVYLDKTGTNNTMWQWKNTIWGSSLTRQGYFTTDANQTAAGCEEWWTQTGSPYWFNPAMYAYWNGVSNSVSGGSLPSDAYLWNQWQRIEWYGKADTTNGALYLNRIGRSLPMVNSSGIKTIGDGNAPWRVVGIGQGLTNVNNLNGGSGSVANLNIYYDQLYIDSSRARVELCDTSTWAARTHCEIQPMTAWNSGEIKIVFNPGTFTPGQTAYLYVSDGNGAVNSNGFDVKIGTTYSSFPVPQNNFLVKAVF